MAFGVPNIPMGYTMPYGQLPNWAAQQAQAYNFPFMQPQIMPPGHFNPMGFMGPQWNQGLMGMAGNMMGGMVEQMMAARGYTFIPPTMSPYAAMEARRQEYQLQRLSNMGREHDVQRAMAHGLFGMDTPVSYGIGSTLMAIPGMANAVLPGGSSQDFARAMFGASQVMRDYTSGTFNIGLTGAETRNLTGGLLDYFAPGGRVNAARTGGLQLGQLGQLAMDLTSQGLLRTDLAPGAVDAAVRRVGADPAGLSAGQLRAATGVVRSDQIGQQLTEYSEVVSMMGELMGARDAPIPEILRNLKELTAGEMGQMTAGEMQNLLTRVREVSRISGMASEAVVSMLKQAAAISQAEGMSGSVGVQGFMNSMLSTRAAQSTFAGPFEGRLNAQQQIGAYEALRRRGQQSDAAVVSVNAAQFLDQIKGQVPASQMAQYETLRSQAMSGNMTSNDLGRVIGFAQAAGVDTTDLRRDLTSGRRARGFYDEYGTVLENVTQNGMAGEFFRRAGAYAQPYGERAGFNASETNAVIRAWEQAGMADPDLIREQLAGMGYGGARLDEMMNFSGRLMGSDRMLRIVERMGLGEYGVNDIGGALQLFGGPQAQTRKRIQTIERRRMRGAELLGQVGVASTDNIVQRFIGSLAESGGNVREAAKKAAGFLQSDELFDVWQPQLSKVKAAYDAMQSDTSPEARERLEGAIQELRDMTPGGGEGMLNALGFLNELSGVGTGTDIFQVSEGGPSGSALAAANALGDKLDKVSPESLYGMGSWLDDYQGRGTSDLNANFAEFKDSKIQLKNARKLLSDLETRRGEMSPAAYEAERKRLTSNVVTYGQRAQRALQGLRQGASGALGGTRTDLPEKFRGVSGEHAILKSLGEEEWNLRHGAGNKQAAFKRFRTAAQAFRRVFYDKSGKLDHDKLLSWAARTGATGEELRGMIKNMSAGAQRLDEMLPLLTEGGDDAAGLKSLQDYWKWSEGAGVDTEMHGWRGVTGHSRFTEEFLRSQAGDSRMRAALLEKDPALRGWLEGELSLFLDKSGRLAGKLSEASGPAARRSMLMAHLREAGRGVFEGTGPGGAINWDKINSIAAQYKEVSDPEEKKKLREQLKGEFRLAEEGQQYLEKLSGIDPVAKMAKDKALDMAKEQYMAVLLEDEMGKTQAEVSGAGNEFTIRGELTLIGDDGRRMGTGKLDAASTREADRAKSRNTG